jgi:ribose/xylose/arabinose/galactoside ABC-type transport system permease subunit
VYVAYFLLAFITYFIFNYTKIGKRICLVGGDRNAALMGGLNERRIALTGFILCGIFSGIAGFLLSSRMNVVTPIFMQAYLLPAIAAPVIGGVSLFGGVGEVKGTLAGVFLLQTISTGLIVIGVSAYLLQTVQGIMIAIAICIDALRRKFYRTY